MASESKSWRARAVGKPCFVCCKVIAEGDDINREHVPAKSFFPTAVRVQYSPNLDRLPVHVRCNQGLQLDEEYFIASFGPMVADDPVLGAPLLDDIRRGYRDGREALGRSVLREFGLVEGSDGSRLKTYDQSRADRVLWKIVRGLAFLETDGALLLDPDTPKTVAIYPTPASLSAAPDWVHLLRNGPTYGRYAKVLDYRVLTFVEFVDGAQVMAGQAWALLLWDRIIACLMFHVPVCGCGDCCLDEYGTRDR